MTRMYLSAGLERWPDKKGRYRERLLCLTWNTTAEKPLLVAVEPIDSVPEGDELTCGVKLRDFEAIRNREAPYADQPWFAVPPPAEN